MPTARTAGSDLVVWTTTPWTLPSNQFAAVHPELDYAVGRRPRAQPGGLIIAAALVETVAGKIETRTQGRRDDQRREPSSAGAICRRSAITYRRSVATIQGVTLLRAAGRNTLQWRVVAADFVTIDSGTGVVHQAPAFGEVDFKLLRDEQAAVHRRRRRPVDFSPSPPMAS